MREQARIRSDMCISETDKVQAERALLEEHLQSCRAEVARLQDILAESQTARQAAEQQQQQVCCEWLCAAHLTIHCTAAAAS